MTYLEYSQLILQKVSFDQQLFEKELRKAIGHLPVGEQKELKNWCLLQYSSLYASIILSCFNPFWPVWYCPIPVKS